MTANPWLKFYPRDWRGDQALRLVSLAARGLWIEMLCVMHEAAPYGHLLVGGSAVDEAALARVVGAPVEEVQALLVELRAAGVLRTTRSGVVFSKRMTADHKRSVAGRKAKEEALAVAAARAPSRRPPTQKPEARAEVEGPKGPATLCAKPKFEIEQAVRAAFVTAKGEDWTRSYLDPCGWDAASRALNPRTATAGAKLVREGRSVLADLSVTVASHAGPSALPQPSSRPRAAQSRDPAAAAMRLGPGSSRLAPLVRDDEEGKR
jgi:hypothetical protein